MQNLSEEDFKQKYLKYKTKYLKLKGSGRRTQAQQDEKFYYKNDKEDLIYNARFHNNCDNTLSSTVSCRNINSAINKLTNIINEYHEKHNNIHPNLDLMLKQLLNEGTRCNCMRLTEIPPTYRSK